MKEFFKGVGETKMAKEIIVFVEQKDNEPRKVSIELLSTGRKIANDKGWNFSAIFLGNLDEKVFDRIKRYPDKIIHFKNTYLEHYTPEAFSFVVSEYAKNNNAAMILAGATLMARDFFPRLAVLLSTGIASDCTSIDWGQEPIKLIRPIFGGRVITELSFKTEPIVATIRPNSFPIESPADKDAEIIIQEVDIPDEIVKTESIEVTEPKKGKVDITEADIVVSGGRGLKAPENFKLIEELAEVIGGSVGASRAVVDSKWRDQSEQVGKSGKTVSPKLYIAAGISGAIHHIMGMDTSKVILAINKDPNAIIFNYADYGIAADLFEVLPVMTEEFKKRLGK
ncbi:MAG: electron transfer flavoprotein subunit alpha/FixB family protein [Spirochaetes bacterium]|nr:MAG: electron transfer flavoprotein subunit alpha/FixB family protein [Spirochaetota bacterium]RLA91335.1 MAG: electron transfer flavoprotein subunit alpha/FixB family protein [Deltaproteobacteria bacterium]